MINLKTGLQIGALVALFLSGLVIGWENRTTHYTAILEANRVEMLEQTQKIKDDAAEKEKSHETAYFAAMAELDNQRVATDSLLERNRLLIAAANKNRCRLPAAAEKPAADAQDRFYEAVSRFVAGTEQLARACAAHENRRVALEKE